MEQPQRILELGATGYVGGRLVPELLSAGFRVRCLTRTPQGLSGVVVEPDVEIVEGDLSDASSLGTAFADVDQVVFLVHSLGAGLLVAEIQTPSDTTFRLYDWAVEYRREPRTLHSEEGAASLLLDPSHADSLPPASGRGVRLLTSNDHYWIREHRTHTELELSDRPGPRVVIVVRGGLTAGDLVLGQGGTAIIPACAVDTAVAARRPSTILEVGLVGGS